MCAETYLNTVFSFKLHNDGMQFVQRLSQRIKHDETIYSRFFHVIGHLALKQLIFLEDVEGNMGHNSLQSEDPNDELMAIGGRD